MKSSWKFWGLVTLLWCIATGLDRLWWNFHAGFPSWDQADYLNSALDHGRAIGFLDGGQWLGWKHLLDLSPKIPPLASLINGSVLSIAGDSPAEAAWSLSIWHGLLLFAIAGWGKTLKGEGFALLTASFVAIAPALMELRTDYVLEMSLTSTVTLALWKLGCWWDPQKGGRWGQSLLACLTVTAAILVKQSALLALLPAVAWASWIAIKRSQATRWQLLIGLTIFSLSIIPWLHHNWITTIGGTNRAVIESAIKEGDPSLFTLENWIWYPRLLPEQIGALYLAIGISGLFLWSIQQSQTNHPLSKSHKEQDDYKSWLWLIITLISAWILTSLSPNKGDRYITPLLPPLLLLLSRGWWEWGTWFNQHYPGKTWKMPCFLITGFLATIPNSLTSQVKRLVLHKQGPLEEIVDTARRANPSKKPMTVIVIPSTPDLNQHNVSYYGRRQGGQLVGRQLGNNKSDLKPLLAQAKWVILAEGDQGSVRSDAKAVDQGIRASKFFIEIKRFPRPQGGSYSLWQRSLKAPPATNFAKDFSKLARGLNNGPKGLAEVFDQVAIQHMLDGHFEYRLEVRENALKQLRKNRNNPDAHWSLALLATLSNRPNQAAKHFSSLEKLLPNSPWPSAYRSVVTLAAWDPWTAVLVADKANQKRPNNVLQGLGDLSGVIGGAIWRLPNASKSIPRAIEEIETALEKS
ncbi:glycosyltransferase family 39 protein [Prochlorococcus sp. MIT 1300]|uniref:glycosyltransferase family 39 protein n=1 Tax=Prochlorococcus sp. MIT 1300 TaxID=3096218 RepID=UPI002A75B32F|nr:glycosyltransferase family 39 protein [Prochlorococcus sp. MIT 1300]